MRIPSFWKQGGDDPHDVAMTGADCKLYRGRGQTRRAPCPDEMDHGDGLRDGTWHLIIGASMQQSAAPAFSCAAPLLEKERHARGATLLKDRLDPFRLHRSRARPGLSPDDHPMDPLER